MKCSVLLNLLNNWYLIFSFQLTETTVEYHLMEKEVEDIKTQQRRKKWPNSFIWIKWVITFS